jgi:hypothetical protein
MATSKHYRDCIVNAKMTNAQLAENVRAFASLHPEWQGRTVQAALINYLIELCGKPPSSN